MSTQNKLIVFEGIDGAGKATQVELLAKRLRAEKKHVSVFCSPRYDTPVGKVIQNALHGEYGDFRHLDPYLASMSYMMDFALGAQELRDALAKGIVVSDRYVFSTFAYHSAKLSGKKRMDFLKYIQNLAYEDLKLPRADRVLYLDVPPTNAKNLMHKKKLDQHESDHAYQRRVASVYKSLAKGKEWRVISCIKGGKMLSREEIHEKIWKAVQ